MAATDHQKNIYDTSRSGIRPNLSDLSISDLDPGDVFLSAVNAAAEESESDSSSENDELENGLFCDAEEYNEVRKMDFERIIEKLYNIIHKQLLI